jgi:hypothetical protein
MFLQAAGDFGKEPFYQMLGYFSLIGLCRLHCILGDYYQALKVLDNIDLSKKVSECAGGRPAGNSCGKCTWANASFCGLFGGFVFSLGCDERVFAEDQRAVSSGVGPHAFYGAAVVPFKARRDENA